MNILSSFCSFFIIILGFSTKVIAQVSPYSLSPKWFFGNQSGLDFSGGSPVFLPGGSVNGAAQEGSSGICDPNGNIVFYSDGYRLYDANHALIQNVNGGTSSTQSCVAVPDPADPANRFYLFTANVAPGTGGDLPASTANLGIHYYHISKSGATVTVLSGPVKIANNDEVSEQLCAGTDGNGNYWIVTHRGGNTSGVWWYREIYSWKVTATGVGGRVTSSIPTAVGNNVWLGSMKINRCQDKLGVAHSSGWLEIYDWDAASGTVTSLIQQVSGLPGLYGGEFSPDGNIFYATALGGNMLYQLDIASGTVYSDPAWISSNSRSEVGTMQLGPDGKIYVVNANDLVAPCYLGIINNPNVAGAGCNYDNDGFTINAGPAVYPNIFRGISNIAWLNPSLSMIVSDNCPDYTFSYSFKNYFEEEVSIVPGSEEWDFGDGTGFHSGFGDTSTVSYTAIGSPTVTLRFRDLTCDKEWTVTQDLSVNCQLPVEWLSIDASIINNAIKVSWLTASEMNNNYFVVERSADGISFFPIGTIEGGSISTQITSYEFIDFNPLPGNNYYHIRQVDFDGQESISKVVSVLNNFQAISLFPNPSEDHFTIRLLTEENCSLIVFDALGREVLHKNFDSELTFGSDLIEGVYIVQIVSGSEVFQQKIIKK